MLSRKERIEALKLEKKKKDILSRLSVRDVCPLDSFMDHDGAYSLMRKAFEKALLNEVEKYNFSKEMGKVERGGATISKEEKITRAKRFVERSFVSELVLFVWDGMVFGLVFGSDDFGNIEKALWKIDGDVVLVSKDAKSGISFLEEEHFIRFSEWGTKILC